MHIPVLEKKVLTFLDPQPNENFIDCTAGEGGHSLAIIEKTAPNGMVLAIDRDKRIIDKISSEILGNKKKERIIPFHSSYSRIATIIDEVSFENVAGVLFDLGMSSWHIDESGRGFSFQKDEPLDMRYNGEGDLMAAEIVNSWPENEIEYILKSYGEERYSRRITKNIIRRRKEKSIRKTSRLVEVIKEAVPSYYWRQKIHFATRTFQALRITVNKELENLAMALPQALEIVEEGGRVVVISFHSLEDRIVKNFFKENKEKNIIRILTKKPVMASEEEKRVNIRSRSAKLRAAVKL